MPEPSLRIALLLAAFPPELAGLDTDPPRGWHAACTGVGALSAAVMTARLIAELQPERVLFVGTCGAYDFRLNIGDKISASETLAISLDELEGRAYRPGVERTCWASTWSLPFPSYLVAVPPAITKTDEGAHVFSKIAAAEHLELTGVFAACHAAGIPVAAALAVANRVGPDAHAQWLEHHARVSRELIDALSGFRIWDRP